MGHLRSHRRRPRRLLTERTPAAGVMRPTIDSCDNVPHVGDWHRWRQLSSKFFRGGRKSLHRLKLAPEARHCSQQKELSHPRDNH